MITISDRLVAFYFDTLAETYKSMPESTATERIRVVLKAVLEEAKRGEGSSRRVQGSN